MENISTYRNIKVNYSKIDPQIGSEDRYIESITRKSELSERVITCHYHRRPLIYCPADIFSKQQNPTSQLSLRNGVVFIFIVSARPLLKVWSNINFSKSPIHTTTQDICQNIIFHCIL